MDSLLTGAERVRERFNRDLELLGIVLTVVDYRVGATRENVARLRAAHGARVFAVEIRVNIRLAEAPEHAKTIFEYDPRATGAAAYQLLAEEFLLRAEPLARRQAAVLAGAGP